MHAARLGSPARTQPADMAELLLELLSEEIPARMQPRAVEDLTGLLRDKLAAAEIPAASLCSYVTPRRLAIIAEGIPAAQPDRVEERRGPRIGAPQPAIAGFLRSAGLTTIAECEIRDTDRGEFYFALLRRAARPAQAVLPELIRAAMSELPWPKTMRYPASDLRWVRPLTSVLCLFDGEILPLPLDRVPVGRTTRGHRFLSPGEISVTGAADYLGRLHAARVVLDRECRRQIIRRGLEAAVAAEGLLLKPDPELLDEVTGLVEFPVVLMGTIDAEFMTLPLEVLATAMRAHQKYFSCLRPDGTPAPRFLLVANNLAADGGKTIVAGNERVLRARLADARFFWDHDRRVRLESRVDALADRVFHAKLGSLRDKVVRMEELADFLVRHVPGADPVLSQRAVRLAKADLSTGMVGEFPELQGIIGRYYARLDEEDPRVADAIADHYKPLGPNDACPTSPESVVVALADKLDSLVSFFAMGEKPTGSRDPFALRRAALGTIRLVLENRLRLPLAAAFRHAHEAFSLLPDPTRELLDFVADRLKVHLREQGVRHDLIAAAFSQADLTGTEDDLVRLLERVNALQALLATEHGRELLVAYRRASSIVGIEERKDGRPYDGEIDWSLLRQAQETALAVSLKDVGERIEVPLAKEEFLAVMSVLASLRDPIDDFFDKVTVNCDEPALRENRLRLLSGIRETMNQVADFSQIEG
jgi:glycyl-tRNA synthetase beta chain